MPREARFDESLWLASLEKTHSGAEGGRDDDLSIMDTYMAGLVRWHSYIGVETIYTCDGHGERSPQIDVPVHDIRIVLWILRTRSNAFRQHYRDSIIYQHPRRGRDVSPARTTGRSDMLDVGEWLYDGLDELQELVGKMRSIRERGRSGIPKA